MDDISERVAREREIYDQGLKRDTYQDILANHAGYLWGQGRREIAGRLLAGRKLNRVLEIGRIAWDQWLEANGIRPEETYCINISERELSYGIKRSAETVNKPKFLLMDAHKLEFPDGHFDLVFGTGILHHLDLRVALAEIDRVLHPDGLIIFSEPLDNNPVGWVVRKLTPQARTEDEIPFRHGQLDVMRDYFDCAFHYEQMLSVPLGLASRALFKTGDNPVMRLAVKGDRALQRLAPKLGPYYRKVTIVGRKRGKGAPKGGWV